FNSIINNLISRRSSQADPPISLLSDARRPISIDDSNFKKAGRTSYLYEKKQDFKENYNSIKGMQMVRILFIIVNLVKHSIIFAILKNKLSKDSLNKRSNVLERAFWSVVVFAMVIEIFISLRDYFKCLKCSSTNYVPAIEVDTASQFSDSNDDEKKCIPN
ncbi:MAG: hypothetical protein MHPSP_004352, partial [Paramarteilia canceri]